MPNEDWLYETRPHSPTLRPKTTFRFRDLNAYYTLDNHDILISDEDAIRAQMRNVLSTLVGSEWGEPYYGSDLPLRIYEPITKITAYMLETDTISALSRWMSDVIIVGVNASVEPLLNDDGYRITIPYKERATGKSVVYSFEALR